MTEMKGRDDCGICGGEGIVREADGWGCVQWNSCVCLNEDYNNDFDDTDPFIDDLIDCAGAIK